MDLQPIPHLPEQANRLIQRVWRSFEAAGGLAGLYVTGSASRKMPSPDDIDMIAVWKKPVADARKRELVAKCRSGRTIDPDTDHFQIDGLTPEFHFMASSAQVTKMVENFCWFGELPPEHDEDSAECLLASLADALPVYDPNLFAHHWQKMLTDEYPRRYQRHRVHEQYASACRLLAKLHRNHRRDDPIYQARARLEFVECIAKALVSLNRRFCWGHKWTREQLERLHCLPENTWEQMLAIITRSDTTAMKTLALSTGELINQMLPDADVAFSLKIAQQVR